MDTAKRKTKNKRKALKFKPIVLLGPDHVLKLVSKFELRAGVPPAFIVTTQETRTKIMEWFGCAPEEVERALSIKLRGIPVVSPRDIMIL